MTTLILRLQTDKPSMWIIPSSVERAQKVGEKSNSIVEVENRFRSGGIAKSKIFKYIYIQLVRFCQIQFKIPAGDNLLRIFAENHFLQEPNLVLKTLIFRMRPFLFLRAVLLTSNRYHRQLLHSLAHRLTSEFDQGNTCNPPLDNARQSS